MKFQLQVLTDLFPELTFMKNESRFETVYNEFQDMRTSIHLYDI